MSKSDEIDRYQLPVPRPNTHTDTTSHTHRRQLQLRRRPSRRSHQPRHLRPLHLARQLQALRQRQPRPNRLEGPRDPSRLPDLRHKQQRRLLHRQPRRRLLHPKRHPAHFPRSLLGSSRGIQNRRRLLPHLLQARRLDADRQLLHDSDQHGRPVERRDPPRP